MKTVWFNDIKDVVEQKRFKESVLGSKIVLDKLIKICYTYIKSGEKVKLVDFDSPAWAYKQAFIAGRNSAFNEIIEVLTVTES
jgi:hypothetical protein